MYKCLSDQTRLRILSLLSNGPLCVCHFQSVLEEPQVKISKHLRYLRDRGLVVATRSGNWIVYSLAGKRRKLLNANLEVLKRDPVIREDRARLKRTDTSAACCG